MAGDCRQQWWQQLQHWCSAGRQLAARSRAGATAATCPGPVFEYKARLPPMVNGGKNASFVYSSKYGSLLLFFRIKPRQQLDHQLLCTPKQRLLYPFKATKKYVCPYPKVPAKHTCPAELLFHIQHRIYTWAAPDMHVVTCDLHVVQCSCLYPAQHPLNLWVFR